MNGVIVLAVLVIIVLLILKNWKVEEDSDGKRDESKYREFERKCTQWDRRAGGDDWGDGADWGADGDYGADWGNSGNSGYCGADGDYGDNRADGNLSTVKSFYDIVR